MHVGLGVLPCLINQLGTDFSSFFLKLKIFLLTALLIKETFFFFLSVSRFDPLVQGKDVLSGLHANTHLAQVNGFISRFEATGNADAAHAVSNFFSAVTTSHSFSTGGSNWFERWFDPASLGAAINDSDAAANTQESCTTYNILKAELMWLIFTKERF